MPSPSAPVGTAGSPGRLAGPWSRGSHLTEQIIALVLSSPPGAKARECDPNSPARWVQQKTDSAIARYGLEQFDADEYWQVAHTAGLTPCNSAYWTALLRAARQQGGWVSAHVSGQDQDRLGDGRPPRPPAQPAGPRLVHRGPHSRIGGPDCHGPTGSPEHPRAATNPTPLPPSPHPHPPGLVAGSNGPRRVTTPLAPDRRPAWPVGCRCPRARPAARWRPWSGRRWPPVSAEGTSRAEHPLEPDLSRVAGAVGTRGARLHAIEAHKQKCREWPESQGTCTGDRRTVVSTLWRAEESKDLRRPFSADHGRTLCGRGG